MPRRPRTWKRQEGPSPGTSRGSRVQGDGFRMLPPEPRENCSSVGCGSRGSGTPLQSLGRRAEAWEPRVPFFPPPMSTRLPFKGFQSAPRTLLGTLHFLVAGGLGPGPANNGDAGECPPTCGGCASASAVWPQPCLSCHLSPQVRAIRLSFVGELGWELHIPRPSCLPVYRAVMTAGAKHGLVNAGYRAVDSLSTEKGVCRSGGSPGARLEAGRPWPITSVPLLPSCPAWLPLPRLPRWQFPQTPFAAREPSPPHRPELDPRLTRGL